MVEIFDFHVLQCNKTEIWGASFQEEIKMLPDIRHSVFQKH